MKGEGKNEQVFYFSFVFVICFVLWKFWGFNSSLPLARQALYNLSHFTSPQVFLKVLTHFVLISRVLISKFRWKEKIHTEHHFPKNSAKEKHSMSALSKAVATSHSG
jgi:hypothetical protein